MSYERFIELLQQLITMVDPDDSIQVQNGEMILVNLLELARRSHKVDSRAYRAIHSSICQYKMLLRHKKDYAGTPGDFAGNQAKRQRLSMVIRPEC